MMPAKTSSEARAAILALHGVGLTSRRIVDALKKQNYVVSKSTVTSVIRDLRNLEAGIIKPPRKIPPQNLPSVRTKELISSVKRELGKSTPLSKRQMAKKYEVSVNTISRVIKIDLKGDLIFATAGKRSVKQSIKEEEDDDADDSVTEKAERSKKKPKKERKEHKSKSSRASDSKRKSSKSSRKSLKTKIPKVRRRRDSRERQPETELLEPNREMSSDS